LASFCAKCGSVIPESATFCGSCGTRTQSSQPASIQAGSVQASPIQASPAQAVPFPQPGVPPPAAPRQSNTLLKVGIALVAVIAVGGVLALAAAMYAAHKVSEKAHAVAHQVLGGDSSSAPGGLASMLKSAAGSDDDDSRFKGDPCRFLSIEDVSHAIGVAIVRAQAQDAGCSYIAHGDPADMTSKHMAAMVSSQVTANGEKPPTAQQQQMMQQITGAFFKQQESSDKDLSAQAATGEVPVLTVSFSLGNADLEMKMNRMAFNRIKQGGMASTEGKSTDQVATGDLAGIGDDAYEMGGTGLIVRKGKVVAHFMFPYCPCSAGAVKPLAAKLASQL
jgi:zinc-ribbon domain